MYPIGKKNTAVNIQNITIHKFIIKYKKSILTINNAFLNNNFIPSVIGVSIPAINSPGPTRN